MLFVTWAVGQRRRSRDAVSDVPATGAEHDAVVVEHVSLDGSVLACMGASRRGSAWPQVFLSPAKAH
jgi:hypothetical protein